MMYIIGFMCALLVAASAETCYDDVENACSVGPGKTDRPLMADCNAKYGGFEGLETSLQAYANSQIETSFEYLLMSTHFGNYEANRDGLKKVFREMSDRAWNDAIDTIKYITKRGGKMNFNQPPRTENISKHKVLQLNEVNSLAKALDTEKQLAAEAMHIHAQARHHVKGDSAVAHFMEEKFFGSQSESIRKLAGHTSDLKQLLRKNDASVSVFLFDEFLQKL